MFAPSIDWLETFTTATRTVMARAGCPLAACIEAGCIGFGVAQACGYVVSPVPVGVLVQAGKEATIVPGPAPAGPPGDGFNGHLVLHFAGDVMVDLTPDQFHAPRRGIHVPQVITVPGVTREYLAAGITVRLPGRTVIQYQELVGNVEWRSLPAWRESSAVTVRMVLREMEALAGSGSRNKSRVSRAR